MRKNDTLLSPKQRLWFAGYLVIAAWVVLLISCTSCAGVHLPDEVPTTSNPAVARLIVVKDGETEGYCTVWKATDKLLVTAGHCCDPGQDYWADGPMAYPGEMFSVAYDDDDHDICVLKGKLRGAPIPLAYRDPDVGERVWTAGYPKKIFLITDGHWAGRDEDGDAVASVGVWGGASGSPVMNTKGQAVGVLRAYYPPMSNLSIIAPIEWLRIAVMQASRK